MNDSLRRPRSFQLASFLRRSHREVTRPQRGRQAGQGHSAVCGHGEESARGGGRQHPGVITVSAAGHPEQSQHQYLLAPAQERQEPAARAQTAPAGRDAKLSPGRRGARCVRITPIHCHSCQVHPRESAAGAADGWVHLFCQRSQGTSGTCMHVEKLIFSLRLAVMCL